MAAIFTLFKGMWDYIKITSFILITCVLDNVVILQGEVTYRSVLGVQG